MGSTFIKASGAKPHGSDISNNEVILYHELGWYHEENSRPYLEFSFFVEGEEKWKKKMKLSVMINKKQEFQS